MNRRVYSTLLALLCIFELIGCSSREKTTEKQSNVIEEKMEYKKTPASKETNVKNKGEKKKLTNKSMVNVTDYIPDIVIDLKYATKDNFTEKIIYDFKNAYLRYGTVKKLMKAQNILKKKKLSLNIWDAYRPVKAQFRLWEVCPNSTYVANPNTGYSSHSRGNTLDVTLITTKGKAVKMPTGFDDFTKKADRDFSDCTEEEAENAKLLEEVMERVGFKGYSNEWWHFSDIVSYPVKKELKNLN